MERVNLSDEGGFVTYGMLTFLFEEGACGYGDVERELGVIGEVLLGDMGCCLRRTGRRGGQQDAKQKEDDVLYVMCSMMGS